MGEGRGDRKEARGREGDMREEAIMREGTMGRECGRGKGRQKGSKGRGMEIWGDGGVKRIQYKEGEAYIGFLNNTKISKKMFTGALK